MAVFRINKTTDYSVISNRHLKEKEMSLKAKGLLSVMLGLPDDWVYSIDGLVAICKEEASAITSTLKELKLFGYLSVDKLMPNETKSGRIEYIYNIYEIPQEKQGTKKQGVENQGLEFQGVENQGQLNTNQSNTNRLNNNNIYISEFNDLWKIYPRKIGKPNALKAYIKARKNGTTFDEVKQGIENYCKQIRAKGTATEYIKHGSTWFNQEAWGDEYDLTAKAVKQEENQQNNNELWSILVLAVNEIKTKLHQEYHGSPYRVPIYQLKDKSHCKPIYDKLPDKVKKAVDFGTFVLYGGLSEKELTTERNRFLRALGNSPKK